MSHHNIDLNANLSAFIFARHGDQKGAHRQVLADEDGRLSLVAGGLKPPNSWGLRDIPAVSRAGDF